MLEPDSFDTARSGSSFEICVALAVEKMNLDGLVGGWVYSGMIKSSVFFKRSNMGLIWFMNLGGLVFFSFFSR